MKNKKLFAILTLVCFLFTLMPVAAMAEENVAEATSVVEVASYEELLVALANDNANIKMTGDITADATQTSGYGKTGIVLDAGDVLDGGGYTLTINDANSTWDSVIAMKGGEVKNLTIAGAMRGVFMPGANGDVVIDNCKFEDVVYTFNSDAGSKDYTVTIKNTTLNGWTSFSNVHKSVTFENCEFGEGSGYAFCRPYQATTFIKCNFDEGFELDASKTSDNSLEFESCEYADEPLSSENKKMFYNGGAVVIDDENVDVNQYVAKIGDVGYTTLEAAFTAVETGDEVKILEAGTYQMPAAAKGKEFTITGTNAEDIVIEVIPAGQGEANGQLDYSLDGSTVTFNNVTIKTNSQLYAGYARLSATYNDCIIQNTYNLGVGNSTFNNCVFNITNEYLRVGGAYSAVFNGCTFNTDGRAILVFQDGTSVEQTVTVKDCTFNATAKAETWNGIHVAAVSIDGTNGTYVVNLEGTNTVDSDFNGLWQIKAGEANTEVCINGIPAGAVAKIDTEIETKYYETLQAAIDEAVDGDTITLLADVTEDVTVVQAENVKITIDGNGKTMNGSITVDGKSARYETAGVTIKNVNFLSDKNSPAAYINLGVSGNNNTRYTNHVTVETCTFDYNGTGDKVAIKSYTGGDKNLIITGCTVSENMHSLLQVTNVEEGLVISDCVVKSKNGVNLNNTVSLEMTGCDFAVKGYAIRAGVSGSTSTVTKTFVIKNNVLSSNCNDGDAVIILRDSAANADISMEENAVLGTTHISGTTADTTVSADANYWDGESAPVVSGTAVTVASYYEKFEDGKLKNLIIPATDITFVKNEVSVECGKTVTLTATLAPSDATDEIVWTSSDTTIVTVDEMGNVTGAKEGTATVTVKIANGETATCTVTVTKASSSSSSSGGGFSGKYNYPVNIADTIGAAVTADQNYAVAGKTVTITVDSALGKQVDEVIVTDADGDVIPVTRVGANKYRFTMPAGKVTVAVTTEAADYDLRIVMQINNKNIVANNRTITNDVAPVIVGDRTLVPVRIVTELLGGTADWDDATRTVTLTIDGKVMKLVIDQPIPGFGTSASIISDRTYVPIRYVAEKLGANVEWIAATQQIMIEQ